MKMHHALPEVKANRLEWQFMTGPQIDALDREKTIVMVTNSPLEVHGPHLPVVTDNLEAEALSLRLMEKLTEHMPDLTFVHLPPMYIAADVLPHVGSVKFRTSTKYRAIRDLGSTLAAQGFRHIWVSSFHGGPRHFVPIEWAARDTNRRHGTKMVSLFSMLITAISGGRTDLPTMFGRLPGLSPEDLEGDAHGGAVETSLMLYLLGQYVQDGWDGLEPNTLDRKLAREGKAPIVLGDPPRLGPMVKQLIAKLKYYESETYSGMPSKSSAETGERMFEILADKATDPLLALLRGELPMEKTHSPMWPLRWVFGTDAPSWIVETAVGYRSRVW